MPAKKRSKLPMTHYEKRRLATLKRVEEALDRLIKGYPTHEGLKDSLCRITVTTVAKEARVSRNTVYALPNIVERIEKIAEQWDPASRPPTKDDKIDELRHINKDQQVQLRQLATENAILLKRTMAAEKETAKLDKAHQHLTKKYRKIQSLNRVSLKP